jgi:predicted ATP-dependent serine protease
VKRVTVDGGREVVVVSGEAGVGKTTLIGEAARVAFDRGACVLFGHCEEDLASPYQCSPRRSAISSTRRRVTS